MFRKLMIISILVMAVMICLAMGLAYYRGKQETARLKQEAITLIFKIEEYKRSHQKAPLTINDLQLHLPKDYPIFYNRMDSDSLNYHVGFPNGPGFFGVLYYDSQTKIWMISGS